MDKNELIFENETRKHQQEVSKLLLIFAQELMKRAMVHDNSKLKSPEREMFIEYTPKLKNTTYGSDEYNKHLEEMKKCLSHHYKVNKHHPEYNDINGFTFSSNNDPIESMDMLDIVEMLLDWLAATQRHADGDIGKSISKNEERFGINKQLSQVFRNTVALIEQLKKED